MADRRQLQWYSKTTGFDALADGGQTNLPLYTTVDVTAIAIKGSTVTRTIMDLRVQAAAVAQRLFFFWGLVVINGDAASAGVFPDPEDMSDRPGWLARGRITTIQASLSDSSQEGKVFLDLRSQRILRAEEDQYHLIVHNLSGGAFALNWSVFIRSLIRLP